MSDQNKMMRPPVELAFAEELKALLSEHLPHLLWNQSWFSEVFPGEIDVLGQ